jgi:glycosyltransferase involved in cell wall biosynthesis
MKVVLTIASLVKPIGGAERSLTELADELLRRGHDVEIVVNERAAAGSDARPFYPLDPSIRIQNIAKPKKTSAIATPFGLVAKEYSSIHKAFRRKLKLTRPRGEDSFVLAIQETLRKTSWFRRYEREKWLELKEPVIDRWRKAIEELAPDVVVSFMPPSFTYVSQALRGARYPLVICYRNDPYVDHQPGRYVNSSHDAKIRLESAKLADMVCVQLETYKQFFPESIQHKIICIPNIVRAATPRGRGLDSGAGERKTILSVGRLAEPKNHALLLRSFQRLHREFPDWDVEIFGQGSLEARLRRLARKLGIGERVSIHPPVRDIEDVYREADIFALPSKWEGFSRAHSEAMAHALPSVALRRCRYAREILTDSDAGLLSEDDPADFSMQLRRLMADDALRARMGMNAEDHVQAFNPKEIFDRWENTLLRAISEKALTNR